MKKLKLIICLFIALGAKAQTPDKCLVIMPSLNGFIKHDKVNDSLMEPRRYKHEEHQAIVYFEESKINELMWDIQNLRSNYGREIEVDYKTGERRGDWVLCYVLDNAYGKKASIYFSDIEEEETMYTKKKIMLREMLLPLVENFDSVATHYVYDIALPTSISLSEARTKFKKEKENLYNLGWSRRLSRSTDISPGLTMNRANKDRPVSSATINVKVEIGVGLYRSDKEVGRWSEEKVAERITLLQENLKEKGIEVLKYSERGSTQGGDYHAQRFVLSFSQDTDVLQISKALKRSPYVLNHELQTSPDLYFMQYISKEADLEKVKTSLKSKFDFIVDISPCSFLKD